MRSFLCLCLALTVSTVISAQQASAVHPTVSSVLDRMKSATRTERSNAFNEAAGLLVAGNASPGDADRLHLGIIQLLIKENSGGLKEPDNEIQQGSPETESAENSTHKSDGEGYGEDESDYYAALIAFVADLNDERTIPALLGAAGTGGIATRAVAGFGKKALDLTLAQVKSQDSDLVSGALFVIRDMLEMRKVSDSDSLFQIKKALRSALGSPKFMVRLSAIGTIEYLGEREEFVPMLKVIAEHDPVKIAGQKPDDGGDNGEFYPARQDARRLLRKIANHEPPIVDTSFR
jgi:hypothetical protein